MPGLPAICTTGLRASHTYTNLNIYTLRITATQVFPLLTAGDTAGFIYDPNYSALGGRETSHGNSASYSFAKGKLDGIRGGTVYITEGIHLCALSFVCACVCACVKLSFWVLLFSI